MPFNFNQPAYTRLRDIYAERRRDIVFWIGAGLSTPAGLPTWSGLRDKLICDATDSLATISDKAARDAEDRLARVTQDDDLWAAMDTLKEILGDASFSASIRSVFEKAETIEPPEVYKIIWSMDGVRGMVSFNIDTLVDRAHRRTRPSEDVASFTGLNAADYAHVLSSRKPFIANLHGVLPSASSWILTKKDFQRLRKPGYKAFIDFLFHDVCVVFLGISADDLAAVAFWNNYPEPELA